MKTLTKQRGNQRGFTLIEILVALAILALIALLASNAFDGARSKAQVMISLGKQIGDANMQLKTDTGCYVNTPKALFDYTAAQTATNNYCNRTFGNTWSRAYMAMYPTDAAGSIKLDQIAAGTTALFTTEANSPKGKRYITTFANVPADIIKQALVSCNNDDASKGDFATTRCRTDIDLTSDTPGKFEIVYDATR
jgi:prepilin-type N-terminal cleavage/methylation domain-containing protein